MTPKNERVKKKNVTRISETIREGPPKHYTGILVGQYVFLYELRKSKAEQLLFRLRFRKTYTQ